MKAQRYTGKPTGKMETPVVPNLKKVKKAPKSQPELMQEGLDAARKSNYKNLTAVMVNGKPTPLGRSPGKQGKAPRY